MNNVFIKILIAVQMCMIMALLLACASVKQPQASTQLTQVSVLKVSDNTKTDLKGDLVNNQLHTAFETRERRYEKIKPLFEHQLNFTLNGVEQAWYIHKSGYIMRVGSSNLYKMDMGALLDYM